VSKVVTVELPPWLSEEEFSRIVKELVARLGGRVDINELRRELGAKPEDLAEEIETYGAEHLELKEKERVRGTIFPIRRDFILAHRLQLEPLKIGGPQAFSDLLNGDLVVSDACK